MTADLCIQDAKLIAGRDIINVSVAIEDGRIIKVGKRPTVPKAEETLDAHGMILLPGAIDVHVHFRDPGETHKEDWKSGSRDAASGGVTTVFDMPNNRPNPTTTLDAVREKKKGAKRKSLVNYGVYYGITGKNIKTINEASKLVCGFKLYMGETTGPLVLPDSATQEKAFRAVSETKKTIVVHAEDNALNKKALEANKTKADALAHARSHPPESEADAVKKVIAYAQETKAKTHITHVSTAQAAAVIREGKKNGGTLSCDTSCNYLLLNQTNLAEKGQLLKVTPPLRTPQDQNALWNAIESETIDMIASDHAPHTLDEKTRGVWEAPSGMPGVGLSLPLLLNEVNNKRLALKRLSELVSHNPAKAFSIKNRGYVAEGFYADLILVDMNAEKKVKGTELYSKCGWTPYEGWTLRGWPQTTVVNGNIVYNDGIIFDEKNGVEVQQA